MSDKKLNRRDFLRFGALTAAGTALAGCCPPAETPEPQIITQVVEKEGETVIETEVVEQKVTVESEPPVPVTWHFVPRGASQADVALISKTLSEMMQNMGVNIELELVPYDGFGGYKETAPLMLASGEACDIVWTSSWSNDFISGASNGYFMALDELMPEATPDLWAKFPPEVWNIGRVGGKLYAIPNQQIWSTVWGIYIRDDITEKYPLDWDTISKGIQGLWDIVPYAENVLASEPNLYSFTTVDEVLMHPSLFGYDYILGREAAVIVDAQDPDREAVYYGDLPEFMELAKVAKEWNDKNLMPAQALSSEEIGTRWQACEFAGNFHQYKPELWGAETACEGTRYEGKILAETIIGTPLGTLTAICAASEHPEEALKVLELTNLNVEFFNTLTNGVEGVHWEWEDKDERLIKPLVDTRPIHIWEMGDTFNGYYNDPALAEIDAFEKTKEINENAIKSVISGFTFDPTPVEAEVAQIRAAYGEYGNPVQRGEVDDVEAAVAQLNEQMEAAGVYTVIEETNRQIQEWAAAL